MNQLSWKSLRILLRITAIAVMLLAAITPRLTLAASIYNEPPESQEQTLLVHFAKDATPEMRDAVVAEMGGEEIAWMPQIGVAEIRMPIRSVAAVAALPSMANGSVTYAEVNSVVSATYTPGDPDFGDEMMSYGLHDVEALQAWDIVTGSHEIVIAVIDSGILLAHPEFAQRLVDGYDFVNEDNVPDDDSGHGTHVAGIIAAALDNGEGVAGVCPDCLLMPVKVLNENNLGSWSQLAQGILFAVDNGARVLNLSLGASIPSETLASSIDYAIESGAIVVAAAGNLGSSRPFYPAALDGVIAVGATTSRGTRWAKSDFGNYIDMVAPGDLIYSTYHDLNNIYRGYTYMSGTSMAAPFVSGVAGLLLSVVPTLSAEDVTSAMTLGADDLGEVGWDTDYGFGRVNAMGALMSPVQGLVEAVGDITVPQTGLALYLPVLNND